MAVVQVKDRIKELRRVRASDLIPNPKNWRRHPVHQADALRGVLSEIGYADALIARETPDGLMLIDGHLRAEISSDEMVPVLVLDVTEEEANTSPCDAIAAINPMTEMRLSAVVCLKSGMWVTEGCTVVWSVLLDMCRSDVLCQTEFDNISV